MNTYHDVVGYFWIEILDAEIFDILKIEEQAPLEELTFRTWENRIWRDWGIWFDTMSNSCDLFLQLHELWLRDN